MGDDAALLVNALRPRITRRRRGDYELRLPPEERAALRSLPAQLRALLEVGDDPSLRRLFPTAYPDDPLREEEYRALVRSELTDKRLVSLDTMQRTVDATHLSEEEVLAWLGALNDLRLVLGTRLDVTEDMEEVPDDDPAAPAFALYYYLGWLEEQVVEALS